MSGIEAAGIALAILPLVINQLDSYVQGIQTLGDFRTKRYRRKLDHYATNLGSQQATFINTLERSLEGVAEYGDGVDGLGTDELKALWEMPSVQSVLQTKFGRNYTPFLRTMRQLSLLLEDLSRKLGWDKMPMEKYWTDTSVFNREVKKFKDIFSRSIYESIFNEINTANEQLAQLMEQSDHRSGIQKQRISKRSLKRVKQNRRLAQSLHNAILKGRTWKCPCRDQHTIHFFLDVPFLASKNENEKPLSPRFRMVFGSPRAIEDAGPFVNAHEIETESEYFQSVSETPGAQYVTVQSAGAHYNSQNRKSKVSFPVQDDCMSVMSEKYALSPPISDICLTLSTVTTEAPRLAEKKLLGCISDGAQRHFVYHLREIAEDPKSQSLSELLATSSTILQAQMKGAFFFSQRDRLSLAVNLAYSVLELHGNWLKTLWRARDIMFVQQPASSLGHPALVLSVSNEMHTSTMCRDTATSALIQNEILFPLGLILVELSLCQPLEVLRTPEDNDENEANTNLKTAARLLQYVESQSGPLYVEVVERCLFWRWKTGFTLEDEEMQDEIYQRIVFPLAENLKNFVGMSQRY